MANMNKVILVGRITRDPELNESGNNVKYTKFTLAVNRATAEQCDFFDCTAFNKKAEVVANYTKKGDILGVDGRLQVSTFQKENGENVKKVDVIVDNVSLFPKSKQSTQIDDLNKIDEELPF